MPHMDDLWTRQFCETSKEMLQAYSRFCVSREVEDLNFAITLHEELGQAYSISMDFLDFLEFARALPT